MVEARGALMTKGWGAHEAVHTSKDDVELGGPGNVELLGG
jgi:hypothetical protein